MTRLTVFADVVHLSVPWSDYFRTTPRAWQPKWEYVTRASTTRRRYGVRPHRFDMIVCVSQAFDPPPPRSPGRRRNGPLRSTPRTALRGAGGSMAQCCATAVTHQCGGRTIYGDADARARAHVHLPAINLTSRADAGRHPCGASWDHGPDSRFWPRLHAGPPYNASRDPGRLAQALRLLGSTTYCRRHNHAELGSEAGALLASRSRRRGRIGDGRKLTTPSNRTGQCRRDRRTSSSFRDARRRPSFRRDLPPDPPVTASRNMLLPAQHGNDDGGRPRRGPLPLGLQLHADVPVLLPVRRRSRTTSTPRASGTDSGKGVFRQA